MTAAADGARGEYGRLDGKVALITGAAIGQGAAEAALFAEAGATVVLGDVQDTTGEATAVGIGPAAWYQHHDVTSEESWAAVVTATVERFGRLDVLVNNAGILKTSLIEHETLETFRQVLDVNLVGTFLGMRAVIAPMRASGGGSIVNISSVSGLRGSTGFVSYGASKWAIRGITKTAAIELARDGIRVNSVHPGSTDTAMTASNAAAQQAIARRVPMRRAGQTSEVAALVLFLASDASSYVTGAEHVIDGGLSAGAILDDEQ